MKLLLVLEAVDELLNTISNNTRIDKHKIVSYVNSCTDNNLYKRFVLRQWAQNNIALPNDITAVRQTLYNFDRNKARLSNKNLLAYQSFDEVVNTLNRYNGVKNQPEFEDPSQLNGVKLFKSSGNYACYIITNPQSLADLGEGTKWTTRKSYSNNYAADYIDEYKWIGQIWKGNRPIIQFTSDYRHIVDVDDEDTTLENYKTIIPYIDVNNEPDVLLRFMYSVIKSRWPEAERVIMQYPKWIYVMCRDVIHGRWPEAESVIIKSPRWACLYAINMLRKRWREAEPIIKTDASAWREYVNSMQRQPTRNNI